MEALTLINGNKKPYTVNLPKIVILGYYNDVALSHITENTGLNFAPCSGGYSAQPESSAQIVALFLTYNFKTQYFNNWDEKNTLFLKSDHHVGFKVDSICYNCCKHNNIITNGMKSIDRLSC